MNDKSIERLMQQDLSEGTDEFRESLLARCLGVLGEEDNGSTLDDDDLEMLAAAGVPGMPHDDGSTII